MKIVKLESCNQCPYLFVIDDDYSPWTERKCAKTGQSSFKPIETFMSQCPLEDCDT